jgi:RNA polymerase sigma-70 factor (ECF subfamily)
LHEDAPDADSMILDVALASLPLAGDRSSAASVTQAEFESFYSETARPFWTYLFRICGDRALAEDLLQETYLRFCRARVPASRAEWRPFLYRIGSNLAADWWRHSGRRESSLPKGNIDSPSAASGGEDEAIRRRELERSLALLQPRQRALLWLAYVEGRTHAEIAGTLSLSRASVKVLLFRARKRLGEILERNGIGPEVLS